jgi:hypothetical protein
MVAKCSALLILPARDAHLLSHDRQRDNERCCALNHIGSMMGLATGLLELVLSWLES